MSKKGKKSTKGIQLVVSRVSLDRVAKSESESDEFVRQVRKNVLFDFLMLRVKS